MNRARVREGIRQMADRAEARAKELPDSGEFVEVTEIVLGLAEAVRLLCDVSEDQERPE